MKTVKSLLCLFLCVSLLLMLPVGALAEEENGTNYPYVFVCGMGGWGEESSATEALPYWGTFNGNLIEDLRDKGFECYTANVSPYGSAWDRACELYAEITGTTVDYGAAHSAEHNHERYGRTYSEPMIEGWGEDSGRGVKKINLIGHSFGGNTIRLLSQLMTGGSEAERATTADDDLSPLFKGGQGDLIFSITALNSPLNGTTLEFSMPTIVAKFVLGAYYLFAGAVANLGMEPFMNIQLEHFGIGAFNNELSDLSSFFDFDEIEAHARGTDNVFYDVSINKCTQMNDFIEINDDIYYFSYACDGTKDSPISDNRIPSSDTMLMLKLFSYTIGSYLGDGTEAYEVDESWLPNDGVVNTISETAPFDEPQKPYDSTNIEKGVWQVMPTIRGDHGTVLALFSDYDSALAVYVDLMNTINALS